MVETFKTKIWSAVFFDTTHIRFQDISEKLKKVVF